MLPFSIIITTHRTKSYLFTKVRADPNSQGGNLFIVIHEITLEGLLIGKLYNTSKRSVSKLRPNLRLILLTSLLKFGSVLPKLNLPRSLPMETPRLLHLLNSMGRALIDEPCQ